MQLLSGVFHLTLKRLPALIFGGWACGACIVLGQPVGSFITTGSMATPRVVHTATLLHNGKVLIAGGFSTNGANAQALSSAELYDPSTAIFSMTANMGMPRAGHTATLLPDGKVLIVGGFSSVTGGGYDGGTDTAELYDPDTETFTRIGRMTAARSWHSATLLNNGEVLIAGGGFPFPPLATAELYDPSTGAFSRTGSMTTPRANHIATLLADGKVLIVPSGDGADGNSAEIYDPAKQLFRATDWPGGLVGATATLLTSGSVLTTLNASECDFLGTRAEMYDPGSEKFHPTGSLVSGICLPTATLLSDGKVLVAAGWFAGPIAQVFDPVSETFSRTGNLTISRQSHTATLLPDGSVLIVGGSNSDGPMCCVPLASAELYHPPVVKPAAQLLSLPGGGEGAFQHAFTYSVVSSQNPAMPGEIVVIYCTGLVDGSVVPPQVAIGGRMGEVLWFGNVPGFSALNQINVRVPDGVGARSPVQVLLNYLGRPSNIVTMAVADGKR